MPSGVCLTVRRIAMVLALISTLPAADTSDTVCPAKGPVLRHVLESEELIAQSSHCAPPRYPALGHQVRIQGVVKLTILVDQEGKVSCVRLIQGHPLLVGAAVEAARKWTFRPIAQGGQPVSFYGYLDFQFSLDRETTPAPCIASPHPHGSSPGPALRARKQAVASPRQADGVVPRWDPRTWGWTWGAAPPICGRPLKPLETNSPPPPYTNCPEVRHVLRSLRRPAAGFGDLLSVL